ncbi:MAG: hypothetical protein R3D33_01410 [Hyphomicrobiaceae bacterium]
MTEEVLGPAQHHILDDIDRQRLVADLDATQRALHRADQIVVEHQPLERRAHEARHHAACLHDEPAARKARQGHGDALLVAGLVVEHFRIGHAGGDRAGQIVEARHLCGRRHQHRGLAAAPRETAGPEVGDEDPIAEMHPGGRVDEVDLHEPGERLCDRLRQRACERGRRRRAGKRRHAHVRHQPELGAAHRHLAGLPAELERRDDRAVADRAERSLQERARLAEHDVAHLDHLLDIADRRRREAEGFPGA